jgi:hypothetical protein
MPRKKKVDTEALASLMDIPEVDKEVRKRLPALLQRMFDIAEGVFIQEERYGEDGPMVRVYQMAPDRLALQFLIENVIGKTPQRLELTGKGGGPMEVVPWAPLTQMEAAGLLPEGGQVVEGVYSVIGEKEESDGTAQQP